jgi:streptogramin lyase
VDANAWRPLAQTDPDDPAIILIDRYAAANGQTYASSDPVQIRFAKAAVTGSVYYWDIAAGRIRRIDDGTADAVEFMPTPPVAMDGSRCVGCHTVSRAGGTWPGASAAARTSARFSI